MRYLHLNHRYWPFAGGSERFVKEVSENFAASGDDVTVITSDAFDLEYFWNERRKRLDIPPRNCHNGVSIRRVPIQHRLKSAHTFGILRRLQGEASRLGVGARIQGHVAEWSLSVPGLRAAIWREGPFDLVHVTNLSLEGMAVAGAEVAKAMGAPYIVTPFMHIGRDDDLSDRRFVTMPHQMDLLRNAALVFAMTNREADFLSSVGVRAPIAVVGAGADPAEIEGGDGSGFRRRHGLDGYLIGTLGALAPEKGTYDTIAAVRELRRQGQDVRAVFAGPAMSGFEAWLESSSDGADSGGVHYLGVIDDQEKRDLLAALDVLVLPSRTESFGIVFLEAWIAGKPVMAADAGAVGEIVRHEENGLLVPFGDPDAIAASVIWLKANPARAREMAEAGRCQALREFTWDRVLKRVRLGYRTALGLADE